MTSRGSQPSPRQTFREILGLHPDLVISFSDLQADIVARPHPDRRRGADHAFNHRTVAGILARHDPRMPASALRRSPDRQGRSAIANKSWKPGTPMTRAAKAEADAAAGRCVYFEEWDEPMISGIRMGVGTYRGRRRHRYFRRSGRRQVSKGADRYGCGGHCPRAAHHHRLVVRQEISAREGGGPPGVRADTGRPKRRALRVRTRLVILQPGPAALTDGLHSLQNIVKQFEYA